MTARVLRRLADLCHRAPSAILALACLGALLAAVYAATHIGFSTDRSNLLKEDRPVQRDYRRFRQEFGEGADLVIVIEGGSSADRERVVVDLTAALERQPELFRQVLGVVEIPMLQEGSLYYLDPGRLERLADELQRARPWLEAMAEGLESLLARLSKPGPETASSLKTLNGVLEQLVVALETRGRGAYRSPFWSETPPARFLLTQGESHLILFRTASPLEAAKQVERSLPAILTATGMTVSVTGEPLLSAEEDRQATRDAVKASVLSVVLVSLLFFFTLGTMVRPQLVVFSLLLGIGASLGFAALTVKTLNLITVNFVCILVGLGVDFGIHLLFRYEEERRNGSEPLEAMARTMETTGVENLTGAVATATAFWALVPTSFRAVSELGLIAGAGVILCFGATVVALPCLLFLYEERARPRWRESRWYWLAGLEGALRSRPGTVLAVCVVTTVVMGAFTGGVRFDYNLLNMQAPDARAVEVERATSYSSLHAVSSAGDLEELRALEARFKALPEVVSTASVVPFLPRSSSKEDPLVQKIREATAGLSPPVAPGRRSAEELESLRDSFERMGTRLRDWASRRPTDRDAVRLLELLDRLESAMENMGPGPVQHALESFENALAEDLASLLELLQAQRVGAVITPDELPASVRERNVGQTGRLMMRISPREDIWDREPLERFVQSLRTVDPEVTGPAVLIYHYLEELRQSYEEACRNALLVICLILLVHFRKFGPALLALMPKLVGIVWMLGIMGFTGVAFDPANSMALPLILGIGLVFGIHVVHRLMAEGTRSLLFDHSTGPAIALSAFSTVLGFGSLMVADHRGLATLGFVMTVGVTANFLAAVLLVPAVMDKKRTPPEGGASEVGGGTSVLDRVRN